MLYKIDNYKSLHAEKSPDFKCKTNYDRETLLQKKVIHNCVDEYILN